MFGPVFVSHYDTAKDNDALHPHHIFCGLILHRITQPEIPPDTIDTVTIRGVVLV